MGNYSIVEIIWLDAMIEEGHLPPESADKMIPIERHNIGYLISDAEDCVKITFGTLENFYKGQQAYDMVMVIPKAMIKELNIISD